MSGKEQFNIFIGMNFQTIQIAIIHRFMRLKKKKLLNLVIIYIRNSGIEIWISSTSKMKNIEILLH